MALVRQHLRQERAAWIAWAGAMACAAFGIGAAYAILPASLARQASPLLQKIPSDMNAFLGGTATFLSPRGWADGLALTGLLAMGVAVFVALASLSVVVEDRDGGGLEFLLTLPVRRGRLLAARTLSVLVQVVGVEAAVCVGVALGLGAVGHPLPIGRLAAAALPAVLAQTALAGTLVVCSLALRDPTQAMLVDLVLAIGLFFLPAMGGHSPVRFVSPFAYSDAGLLLGGGFPTGHAVLLAAWTAVAFVLAGLWFARMDT